MRSILEVSTIDFKFEVEGRNLLANTWVSSPHFLLHIAPTYPIFNWSYKPLIKHSSPYPIFCRILVGEIFIFAGYDPIYCNYMSWVKHGKTLCGSEAWLEVITPRDHMSLLGFIQLRISKDANFFLPIEYLIYIHILKKGGVAGSTLFRCGFPIFPLNPWSPWPVLAGTFCQKAQASATAKRAALKRVVKRVVWESMIISHCWGDGINDL
jgi:hypothetical protein